jgi:hypothetical protein
MKILIVSKSFYPENSPRSHRATELAKCFAKLGHNVKVICPLKLPFHKDFSDLHAFEIKNLGNVSWSPIHLTGKGLVYWLRRALRRFLQIAFVYPDIQLLWLVRKALKNEKNYDLLISIAVPYPVHWGVALSRNSINKIANTWVADCGDPFMGQENDSFKYPFYFKYVEKWFCRKADFITVPTQGAIQGYYHEFYDKIKVVPQGFDFDEEFPEAQVIKKSSDIVFAYGGLFISGRRDPTEFIKYILSKKYDFQFHIFTNSKQLIKNIIQDDNRIILYDMLTRKEFLGELKNVDFVVNFENKGSKQTPSKLIDYLIVGKPILSIKTGELNQKLVDEFLFRNFDNKFRIDNPCQYKIENVVRKFIEISNRV